MAPKYKIRIDAGSTYRRRFLLQDINGLPINLTGYKARSKFRFDSHKGAVAADLTTENGRISILPSDGILDLVIPNEVTETMATSSAGRGVYDLEIYLENGDAVRILEGSWVATPEATRDA